MNKKVTRDGNILMGFKGEINLKQKAVPSKKVYKRRPKHGLKFY